MCTCKTLSNFRKFEKFQTNHFVLLLKYRRSKANANSKPTANIMRIEFPKMGFFVSKVPSKQSKLQFQPCKKSECSVKSINLYFPSTSTVTAKDKNVKNSISENVSSSWETSLNSSLNLSLAREEISFLNSVTLAAQPGSFSSKEISIDFSKILGCKKDVSTSTKLKDLSNAEKPKLMRSAFVPSKSYVLSVFSTF